MSGGSLQYICYQDKGRVLADYQDELKEVTDYLRNRGHDSAAEKIDKIVERFNKIALDLDSYTSVLKAVEWAIDGDWVPEDVDRAVKSLPRKRR